jgi:hypothetical protein
METYRWNSDVLLSCAVPHATAPDFENNQPSFTVLTATVIREQITAFIEFTFNKKTEHGNHHKSKVASLNVHVTLRVPIYEKKNIQAAQGHLCEK